MNLIGLEDKESGFNSEPKWPLLLRFLAQNSSLLHFLYSRAEYYNANDYVEIVEYLDAMLQREETRVQSDLLLSSQMGCHEVC